MYKANEKVKYRCPMKGESNGVIIAKFKVLDDLYECNKDSIVYLINHNAIYQDDFVFEENIISKID